MSTRVISGSNPQLEETTFEPFFDRWLLEQERYLHDLISAADNNHTTNNHRDSSSTSSLRRLRDRVMDHYEHYYKVKSAWAHHDVKSMLSPSWRSSLEDAFLWIGGWRPSMAFHLLYSKSGLQLETKLHDLIRGLTTADLSDISAAQLRRIDELQRATIRDEKVIAEKMAKVQESVADSNMVDLSHMMSEMIRVRDHDEVGLGLGLGLGQEEDMGPSADDRMNDRVDSALAIKEKKLEEILRVADDLRLETLRAIVDVLTPIQAVHFLIAVAELHLRLRDWGKRRDAATPSRPST
ncbi:Protein DOG1-like 4 [Linum grandiflorum]